MRPENLAAKGPRVGGEVARSTAKVPSAAPAGDTLVTASPSSSGDPHVRAVRTRSPLAGCPPRIADRPASRGRGGIARSVGLLAVGGRYRERRERERRPRAVLAASREPAAPLGFPPRTVERLLPLPLLLRQIVVVAEVLLGELLQLVPGRSPDGRLLVGQRVNEPLQPVATAVLRPPVAPAAAVAAEVLAGDEEEGAPGGVGDVVGGVRERGDEGGHHGAGADLAHRLD